MLSVFKLNPAQLQIKLNFFVFSKAGLNRYTKQRRLLKRFIWSTILLLITAISTTAWSMESFQTDEGKVLLKKSQNSTPERIRSEPVRDPFNWAPELVNKFKVQPVIQQEEIFAGLQLSAIMWDEKLPLVVINNTLLEEGESIRGAIVTKIFHDKVLLKRKNQTHTLQFEMVLDLDNLSAHTKEKDLK